MHVEWATTEQSRVSLTTSDISRIQRARILRLLRKRASFRKIFFADPRKKTNRRDRWIYIKFERQFPEPKNDRNRHVTISKLLRSNCRSLLFAVFQLISTNDDNCMTFFLSIFLYSFDRWTCNICCCSIRYEIRRKYFKDRSKTTRNQCLKTDILGYDDKFSRNWCRSNDTS